MLFSIHDGRLYYEGMSKDEDRRKVNGDGNDEARTCIRDDSAR